jgi:hypothetical protein
MNTEVRKYNREAKEHFDQVQFRAKDTQRLALINVIPGTSPASSLYLSPV